MSLIVLAACGDNLDAPRLAAARYVYDDGTEEIDRHELYDRSLDTLCTPTEFSDGTRYCMPASDAASYTDEACTNVVGRVPHGTAPMGFFVTSYFGNGGDEDLLPSRVFRGGAPTARPIKRYEKYAFGCVVSGEIETAYDYYDVGEKVELAPVKLRPWFRGSDYVVDAWQAAFLSVPARIEGCDVIERANADTTTCLPAAAEPSRYLDLECTQPVTVDVPSERFVTYEHDPTSDCVTFYGIAGDTTATVLYDRVGTLCIEVPLVSLTRVSVLAPIDAPKLTRTRTGTTRIQLISLADLPLQDALVHDTQLAADCLRAADGRCLPAMSAKVETRFADSQCTQPIDVAMVPSGGCHAPMPYAERDGSFYPVLDVYARRLFALDTGETCSAYAPPAPFVVHSIGQALGEDAFARARLLIE